MSESAKNMRRQNGYMYVLCMYVSSYTCYVMYLISSLTCFSFMQPCTQNIVNLLGYLTTHTDDFLKHTILLIKMRIFLVALFFKLFVLPIIITVIAKKTSTELKKCSSFSLLSWKCIKKVTWRVFLLIHQARTVKCTYKWRHTHTCTQLLDSQFALLVGFLLSYDMVFYVGVCAVAW